MLQPRGREYYFSFKKAMIHIGFVIKETVKFWKLNSMSRNTEKNLLEEWFYS